MTHVGGISLDVEDHIIYTGCQTSDYGFIPLSKALAIASIVIYVPVRIPKLGFESMDPHQYTHNDAARGA